MLFIFVIYIYTRVPLYHGTPRILPMIAPLLLGVNMSIPSLSQIPGSILTYKFFPKPSIRSACFLWPESCFIGPSNMVPGIEVKHGGKSIRAAPMDVATVSKVKKKTHP
jgi:hypothetical protein